MKLALDKCVPESGIAWYARHSGHSSRTVLSWCSWGTCPPLWPRRSSRTGDRNSARPLRPSGSRNPWGTCRTRRSRDTRVAHAWGAHRSWRAWSSNVAILPRGSLRTRQPHIPSRSHRAWHAVASVASPRPRKAHWPFRSSRPLPSPWSLLSDLAVLAVLAVLPRRPWLLLQDSKAQLHVAQASCHCHLGPAQRGGERRDACRQVVVARHHLCLDRR
mmetsp:Transcript_36262/g.85046  ORF Transcript_36262/g.85046 Transcript_36262/m.85046 type:complete len:217 (+) Transcript_36262:1163-1813(+)